MAGSWQDGSRGVFFEDQELADVTGGVLVRRGPAGALCTDTRQLALRDWFLALRGDNFDGHNFLTQAAAAGCAGAVAEGPPPMDWSRGYVQVQDTLRALQLAARDVRLRFAGPVIGVTGSTGKTTTRAMITLALSPLGPIHETAGNFNNHIGVPLTLLAMPSASAAAVLELGMNHPGEIAELAQICCPTVRLVTNVGPVHVEGCGSEEGVARAKAELFDAAQPGDICVVNADDKWVRNFKLPEGVRAVRYGRGVDCDVRMACCEPTGGGLGVKFVLEHREGGVVVGTADVEIAHPGLHLAQNACAAAAVAVSLGVPLPSAARQLARYSPVGARLRVETVTAVKATLLNDAYNANPMSMRSALELLEAAEGGRGGKKIALLGDMLELGHVSEEAHREILELCLELRLPVVGVCGSAFKSAASKLSKDPPEGTRLLVADDVVQLAKCARAEVGDKDIVLVKGSRGMRMERVVELLCKQT